MQLECMLGICIVYAHVKGGCDLVVVAMLTLFFDLLLQPILYNFRRHNQSLHGTLFPDAIFKVLQ